MKHCVDCWFNSQQVSEATYLYDGYSVCRVHLEGRHSRMVSKPKVTFVDKPKPRKGHKK